MEQCKVCNFPIFNSSTNNDTSDRGNMHHFKCCYRCGEYVITEYAFFDFDSIITTELQKTNLSGWIREHQKTLIDKAKLKSLASLQTPSVGEKAERLLLYLAKNNPTPGSQVPQILNILPRTLTTIRKKSKDCTEYSEAEKGMVRWISPLFGVAYAGHERELKFLLVNYLEKEKQYLDFDQQKITPKGWAYIDSLTRSNIESNTVFIAMKFEDELKDFSEEWVEKAIRDMGYNPLRIDKHPHNNLIDNEIIAGIKRSKFIIADLTDNNNGVYFEAGFAKGLGLDIIYLCNEEFFKSEEKKDKIHFDTNHYSIIPWNYDQGEKLVKDLTFRIEATNGKYERKK